MKRLFLAAFLVGLAAPGHAQEGTVDPRAIAQCEAVSQAFTQVADCLPYMHIAFVTQDAFRDIFPEEAQVILDRCMELNEDIRASASCASEAVRTARELAAVLPEGAQLSDPVFEAVNDPALVEAFEARVAAAWELFPIVSFAGAPSARAYQ